MPKLTRIRLNLAIVAALAWLPLNRADYLLPLPVNGALTASGALCDSTRLIRCQQDVLRDLQAVSLQAASLQFPIQSGPPYSPIKQHQLAAQQQQLQAFNVTACRLVRANLACLLTTTPACYEQGIQAAQNTDVIYRAKRFLEQNGCNEPDVTWQSSSCYRSPEIRSCEERYGFASFASVPSLPSSVSGVGSLGGGGGGGGVFATLAGGSALSAANTSACQAYQAFKYCAESHLRLACKVHEMDMANEYLIDRASDLAWRCPAPGANVSAALAQVYALNNGPAHQTLSPYSAAGTYSDYYQRPVPPSYTGGASYGGAGYSNGLSAPSSAGLNFFGRPSTPVEQAWERFHSPLDDPRYGVSRFGPAGSGSGVGDVFERLVATANAAGTGLDLASDCPAKAAPFARECDNTLVEQHRLAGDSRDGNELQRRLCCSLFQYRDCISRVVLDRCADSTPTAVEILMGPRRKEITLTCRNLNRDLCSGALALFASPFATYLATLLASYLVFRGSRQQRSL